MKVASTEAMAPLHAMVRVRYFSSEGSRASNLAMDLVRVSSSVFCAVSALACALSSASFAVARAFSAASFAAGGVWVFLASALAF
ncbi:MAG: hypothetical protein EB141_13615 [Verrucomicrobia bacterium]|nr:hypothetical protein [Verrucomicrobiota bacterium]